MTPAQDDANLTSEASAKDPGQSSMNSQGVQGWFQEWKANESILFSTFSEDFLEHLTTFLFFLMDSEVLFLQLGLTTKHLNNYLEV